MQNNNKKKILFIGHNFHNKTLSNRFLLDYISEFFDVRICYCDKWQGGLEVDKQVFFEEDYHQIIFYQIPPYKKIAKNKKIKKIIFIPMYDGIKIHDIIFQYYYKHKVIRDKITYINFSKKLHDQCVSIGLKSYYLKYFPSPSELDFGDVDKLFFWQRRKEIDINLIEKLFEDYPIKIHLHQAPDTADSLKNPSIDQIKKFKITISNWFKNKNELISTMKDKAFFIAPRFEEGIGMSFLEAMAQGKAVIANNMPTMNEYIINGYNGYLVNFKKPKKILIENIRQIQQNAHKTITDGYQNWQKEKSKIIDIIDDKIIFEMNKNFLEEIKYILLATFILIFSKTKKIIINIICILVFSKKLKNKIRRKV
jgi:glycosyltransferase involved in cell wall biosynthesis